MKRRTLVAAALVAAGVVAGGGTAALAVTSGGPQIQPASPVVGPYYKDGPVNLCVNQITQGVRVETRTLKLGNCSTNEVQLTVSADPGALTPPAAP